MTYPKTPIIRIGDFLFKFRNLLFPVFVIALCLWRVPVEDYAFAPGLEEWKDIVAILIVLAGLAIRATVIGFRYIQRGGKNKRVYAADLVTDGIFGLCRNPLYVGNLTICAGLMLMHGDPLVMIVGMAAFLFSYTAIVRAEEAFLLAKFGPAYEAYMRDVPRWLPKLGQFREATEGMSFNWSRVIAKDYTTFVSAAAALLIIEQWEEVFGDEDATWLPFVILAVVLLLILASASRAKKDGLIGRS